LGKEWTSFAGDEFSINIQTSPSKIWARKGSRPLFPTSTKGGKVNTIGALNNKTGKVFTLMCDKINRFSFLKFLKKLLRYHKKVFLIVDNASWHHAKIIGDFLRDNKHRIIVEFLPAYSPEYNPAEQCWKAVKSELLTLKLFLSVEGMSDQVKAYFQRKRFFNLKLERFLCP
jgi:transposase